MEHTSLPIKETVYKYGLYLGLISVAFSIMLFSQDMHYQNDSTSQIISTVISVVMIVLAQLHYKKINEGIMPYGQSFKIGLGVTMVNGVIVLIYYILLTKLIDPDFYAKQTEFAIQKMLDENPSTSEETIEQVKVGMSYSQNVFLSSGAILLATAFFGSILSLLTSIFTKGKKIEESIDSI